MLNAYPIILTPSTDGGFIVSIPDFNYSTQGENIANAIVMARDAIGLVGIDLEDDGKPIPQPSPLESIATPPTGIINLVDVDFVAYRESMDNKAIRKNCTIPSWLNTRAEKAGINFSKTLQDALIDTLNIQSIK